MSLSTMIKNPNRGALKLDHDLTPRDLNSYNTSTDALIRGHENHGFKGFPVNNFETVRDPILANQSLKTTPRNQFHGVPHHLDTRKPLTVGEATGFQYGSDETELHKQSNSRVIGRLATKTSAELSKFRLQQEEADYNIRQFKSEQQQRLTSREEEKKRDMEMLKSYNPWGQPGAGAPLRKTGDQQAKKSKIDDRTMFHSDFMHTTPRQSDLNEEYGNFNDSFGRPGNGAPLRTDSGKVKAELKGDADIRFQKTEKGKAVYDNELRYQTEGHNKQEYQQVLDYQMQELKQRSQADRLENLKKELETLRHDPFNKPGAGAPNKTRSGLHTMAGRRITLSHDLVEQRKAYNKHEEEMERAALNRANSDFELYYPWGKGVGQPIRDQLGDIRRFPHSDGVRREVYTENSPRVIADEEGTSLEMSGIKGGAGAPRTTPSGNVQARKVISMRRNELGDTSVRDEMPGYSTKRNPVIADDPEYAIHHPFGKSGAGAPLRNDKGQVITQIYGKMRGQAGERTPSGAPGKKEAAQQYLNELQREMAEQRRSRDEFDSDLKKGAEGLADLMYRGQVGKPRRDPNTGLLLNQHLGRTDVTLEQTQERPMKSEHSLEYHTELEKAATERKRANALDHLKEKQESTQHQKQMNNFWGRPGGGAPNKSTKKVNLENILYSPRKEKDYKLVMPYASNPEEDF